MSLSPSASNAFNAAISAWLGVLLLILAGAVVSFEHDASWMATASALFAGYLAGRPWLLIRRAVRSPHTELGTG